ncbi:MAG: ribonuclease HII [Elusimicrobia bacterium]|nr:ribonuclease HII [Elusimicrobiota bacterium]
MTKLQKFDAQFNSVLIGIDEAGRGPLAGPVVAAAVCAGPEFYGAFKDVDDSKKLTEKQREKIFELILKHKISFGVGFASSAEIDSVNILQATFLAMRRAAQKFAGLRDAQTLVDGNHKINGYALPQTAIIDGDAKSFSIAMASIIAKVYRDRYMKTIDTLYPQYGFAAHKGYGCAAHIAAINKHGICKEHRRSFGPVRQQELFI